MRKLLFFLMLLLPGLAYAQIPPVNDTIPPSGQGAAFTPSMTYGFLNGDFVSYLKRGTSAKKDFYPSGTYVRKYFSSKAQLQLAKDSLVNLYNNQTIPGVKTFSGSVTYFNNQLSVYGIGEFNDRLIARKTLEHVGTDINTRTVYSNGMGTGNSWFTYFDSNDLIFNRYTNTTITGSIILKDGGNIVDGAGKYFLKQGDTTISGTYVPKTLQIITDYGLTGGGDLSANRTLKVDTATIQTIANFFPKGDTRYTKNTDNILWSRITATPITLSGYGIAVTGTGSTAVQSASPTFTGTVIGASAAFTGSIRGGNGTVRTIPSLGASAVFSPMIYAAQSTNISGIAAGISNGGTNRAAALVVNDVDAVWGLQQAGTNAEFSIATSINLLRFSTAGLLRLPQYTTAGVLINDASGNVTSSTAYALLASPALTGAPTAPTQTAGDNSTKIATTAYVDRVKYLRLTGSGTGAATTISIAHGQTGVTSASIATVTAINAASSGIAYITLDATNINIIYTAAPVSGTNNLSYNIILKP